VDPGPVSGSLLFDLFVWIWALSGVCVSTIFHIKLRLEHLKAFPKAHQKTTVCAVESLNLLFALFSSLPDLLLHASQFL
jgi:hypothetical protein